MQDAGDLSLSLITNIFWLVAELGAIIRFGVFPLMGLDPAFDFSEPSITGLIAVGALAATSIALLALIIRGLAETEYRKGIVFNIAGIGGEVLFLPNYVAAHFDFLRKIFDRVVLIANAAASGWIFVLMMLITSDITLRFVFGSPISGVTEIVEISIIIVTFLQLAHTLKVGRVTRSDALYSRIMTRFPTVGNVMGTLFAAAGVGLMIAIMWGGWPKWLQSLHGDYFVGNKGVFTFPEWPQRLVLVIGCGMMAIQFFLMGLDNIRGLFGKPPLEYEKAVDVEVDAVEERRS